MLNNIIQTLKTYQRFAIVSHIKMDGDAMGSMLGLTHVLRAIGKQVQPLTQGFYPDNLQGLPGTEDIIDINEGWANSWLPEVLICVDSASSERVSGALNNPDIQGSVQEIINIDHHISNEYYGSESHNWVKGTASSTGEMLVELCNSGYLPIPLNAAINFYTAIMTDTGNFTNANTTPESLRYGADLIDLGVVPNELVEELYRSKDHKWLHLEGRVLGRVKNHNDQIIWSYVTQDDFQETETSPENSGSLVSMLTKIKEYEIVVMFIEQESGDIKLSFRGKGEHNLSEIAANWEGGGGHARAAGTKIPGRMENVITEVITYLKSLTEQRENERNAFDGSAYNANYKNS